MGKRYQDLVNNIVACAKHNTGLALIEVWDCEKCGVECFRIHPMDEVLACPGCGQHHASKLERYKTACEAGADAEIAFKAPAYDPGEPHL